MAKYERDFRQNLKFQTKNLKR